VCIVGGAGEEGKSTHPGFRGRSFRVRPEAEQLAAAGHGRLVADVESS